MEERIRKNLGPEKIDNYGFLISRESDQGINIKRIIIK